MATVANATEVYAECVAQNQGSVEDLLICLAGRILEQNAIQQQGIERNQERILNISVLFAASLVFFMQAGFAMVCAGAVRKKNLQNTMLKNLLDACSSGIAFYVVGYAFAFGDGSNPNGFIGTTNFFLMGVDNLGFWLFQYAFSAASATIVAGTLAERCQMSAYFYYSILLAGFVYPVIVHTCWSEFGFLSADHADPLFGVGVVDVAGSGVVHLTGGVTALVATFILGPRRGRFHDVHTGEPLETPTEIQGHNISLQLLGTLILWFGWYGFNSGSALLVGGQEYGDILASLAAANTTLAAGASGLSCLFGKYYTIRRLTGKGRFDLVGCMNGVLSGLVAVTAPCGVIDPWASVIIGVIAGLLYLWGSWVLVRFRLDDAVDAIPVHMVNGIWGMIATGLFATPGRMQQAFGNTDYAGLCYSGPSGRPSGALLAAQMIGTMFIVGWTVGVMFPFFYFLELRGSFRVGAREEVTGLDREYFGENLDVEEEEAQKEQIAMLTKQVEEQLRKRSKPRSVGSVDENLPQSIGVESPSSPSHDKHGPDDV